MPEPSLFFRRILVVEDEYMLADDLRQELEEAGSIVLGPVARVEDALAIIAAEPLDLALLDINLGGEKSFPIADELIAQGVPFIFATGYSAGDVPARYANIQRCRKPLDPREVLKAVAREMGAG